MHMRGFGACHSRLAAARVRPLDPLDPFVHVDAKASIVFVLDDQEIAGMWVFRRVGLDESIKG